MDKSDDMYWAPLRERLADAYDDLSPQLRVAARYILDHPQDVALLSMREQARRCGANPATMLRLAKYLGLEGYDTIRGLYAQALRRGGISFAGKSHARTFINRVRDRASMAEELSDAAQKNIAMLSEPGISAMLDTMAAEIARANHVYCLGLRGCYAPIWHFRYMLSLSGNPATLLNTAGGTGFDSLYRATRKDILFVASVEPYSRSILDVARLFAKRGAPILALTDSQASPVARLAKETLIVDIECPSYYHGLTSAFLACEMLAKLVASKNPERAIKCLTDMEESLYELDLHVASGAGRRSLRGKSNRGSST